MNESKTVLDTYSCVGPGNNTEGDTRVVLSLSHSTLGLCVYDARKLASQILMVCDQLENEEADSVSEEN